MSKTNIEEINRNIYDIKNKDEYDFKIKKGLTPEIIEEISKQKNDPKNSSWDDVPDDIKNTFDKLRYSRGGENFFSRCWSTI